MSGQPQHEDAARLAAAAAAGRRDDAYKLTYRAFQAARLAYVTRPTAENLERMATARRAFLETWGADAR